MTKAGLIEDLARRFGEPLAAAEEEGAPEAWQRLAERGSCRAFDERKVPPGTLETLCALALSAPSKSDLQQRDIILVEDPELRSRIDQLLTVGPLGQAWIGAAPHLLIFCGNNRRLRLIHEWRGRENANDHLDALFNAAVDAAVALSCFVTAAEAAGLGCCPISAVRNHATAISALLALPDHVFPVAGLALGYPADARPKLSLRLPLSVTLHRDRYREQGLRSVIEAYDRRREAAQPYSAQRYSDRFGRAAHYGWSEDKARQYAVPERADFGRFLRAKGFNLD